LKPWRKFSFYGRFLKVFAKNLQKTPSAKGIPWEEKGPFLLVRFLWANKENEQDPMPIAGGEMQVTK
jgi:hypothetical protein